MPERGFYWATTHWSIIWGNQNQLRCVTSFGPMEPHSGFEPLSNPYKGFAKPTQLMRQFGVGGRT